jgi:Uma2 family endonuclease
MTLGESTLRSIDLPYTIRIHGVTDQQFDEWADEDTKAELIDGVMIVHSPATIEHDARGEFIRSLMSFFADERDAGSVLGPDSLVHLATCRRFGPDIYFVRKGRAPNLRTKEFEGAPDLIVEILSPSNRDLDLEDKRPAYQEAGVTEIWFVDPEEQQVIVDRKRGKRYVEEVVTTGRVESKALQRFWIKAGWLWKDPLPNKMTCLRAILKES